MQHSRQKKGVNATFGARNTPLMLLSSHEKEKTFTLPLFFFGKPLLTIVLAVSEKNAYQGNVNNVTSIATVYWCINVDSTFVYLGPLDFNKDSNNHICWRQMLYKGPVIIITALFSDCKTFGKSLRISVKFCHWNPKNSEIRRFCRNSAACGGSALQRTTWTRQQSVSR